MRAGADLGGRRKGKGDRGRWGSGASYGCPAVRFFSLCLVESAQCPWEGVAPDAKKRADASNLIRFCDAGRARPLGRGWSRLAGRILPEDFPLESRPCLSIRTGSVTPAYAQLGRGKTMAGSFPGRGGRRRHDTGGAWARWPGGYSALQPPVPLRGRFARAPTLNGVQGAPACYGAFEKPAK